MKRKNLFILFATLVLSGCGNTTIINVDLNELGEIKSSKDILVQGEKLQLTVEAPSNIDVTWSVSNDLATINSEGLLTVNDKDGTFIVTASYGENNEFKASKLLTIHTPSIRELTRIMYNAGSNYNYTVSWTGKLINDKNEVIDKEYVNNNEVTNATSDPVALYEDLVEKGNLYKAEMDGYYYKYGVDGEGNEYEGGGYNSPDGYVHNFDMVKGKFTDSGIDQYLGMAAISDYKEGYTGDLSKFVDDEFKIEDSNLTLSEDKTYYVYDSKKDENNFIDTSAYSIDYSIPQVIFNTVDGSYASIFAEGNFFNDLTGKISYTDNEITMEFDFKNVALSSSNNFYTYRATFKIYDIGTTEISGLKEQIQKDKENLNK